MPVPIELIWAFIGLLLTIGGAFFPAFVTTPIGFWDNRGFQAYSLGVNYQIGAVLLVGCMGGKNAAALSQIAYIILGLTLWPVFSQGGGIGYIKEPAFGYLLGFIPGAWVCGWMAFKVASRLESIAFSCLCGLFTIHAIGLTYLVLSHLLVLPTKTTSLFEQILKYSVYPLPGQLAVVCAIALLSFVLRRVMFY
ncbi:biotin transporter BioY [Microcoleus sp.]|uniref:biotin transporter BioY n=1 Tax=Microcoleus sp. TaxID=44472 RepID=UPI003525D4BA